MELFQAPLLFPAASERFKTCARGIAGWVLLSCLCAGLVACEPRDKEAELRAAVARFHALYNEQKFGEIYDSSSRLYRRRVSREESARYFAELYRRDGPVEQTRRENEIHERSTGFEIFVLSYTTKFARREAAEDLGFRYATSEPGPVLAAYSRE